MMQDTDLPEARTVRSGCRAAPGRIALARTFPAFLGLAFALTATGCLFQAGVSSSTSSTIKGDDGRSIRIERKSRNGRTVCTVSADRWEVRDLARRLEEKVSRPLPIPPEVSPGLEVTLELVAEDWESIGDQWVDFLAGQISSQTESSYHANPHASAARDAPRERDQSHQGLEPEDPVERR